MARTRFALTTSVQDSGLLDYLLSDLERETGLTVEAIAVGTGQALQMGERGEADVLLVHARDLEDAFMAAGHGVRREDVMHNDLVIVGPESDPAGIEEMGRAADALAKIAAAGAPFVSRGDKSGTHIKEQQIWAHAGIQPSGSWYTSAGQGMGATLAAAAAQGAYTLSDRATYLSRASDDRVILVEGDEALLNSYRVIAVKTDKSADGGDSAAD